MKAEHGTPSSRPTPSAMAWASSKAGQEAMDRAILRAEETAKTLDAARKVDFDVIRRPLGMRI